MAVTNTTNYNLQKPDQGTTAWHTYVNGNMDTIDAAMKTGTGANVLPKRDANGNILNIGNQITAISANTTLTPAQSGIINVTTAATPITITLPTAATAQLIYTIKKVDSGVGIVSIATTSSQTIDGVSTKTLTNQYASIILVSDGANWIVESTGVLNPWGDNTTSSRSAVRITTSAIQTLAATTYTKVTYNTKVFDNLTEWDTTNYKYVAKTAGIILVSARVATQGSASNRFILYVYKNGVQDTRLCDFTSGGTFTPLLNGTAHIPVVIGDYIEIFIYSGVSLDTIVATTQVDIVRIA